MLSMDKVKATKNKQAKENLPDYIINYDRYTGEDQKKQVSYQILSRLKGTGDVLVEVSSAMLSLPPNRREGFVMDLLKQVKHRSLDFRYRKAAGSAGSSPISFLFSLGGKTQTDHEVLFRIPDTFWKEEDLSELLPAWGVKFYLCKEGLDTAGLLDSMFNGNILEDEKWSYFRFIAFDACSLGQMGLFCSNAGQSEIEELLFTE